MFMGNVPGTHTATRRTVLTLIGVARFKLDAALWTNLKCWIWGLAELGTLPLKGYFGAVINVIPKATHCSRLIDMEHVKLIASAVSAHVAWRYPRSRKPIADGRKEFMCPCNRSEISSALCLVYAPVSVKYTADKGVLKVMVNIWEAKRKALALSYAESGKRQDKMARSDADRSDRRCRRSVGADWIGRFQETLKSLNVGTILAMQP